MRHKKAHLIPTGILISIFVIALLLRGLELYVHNYLFLYDHGIYYEDVRHMVEEGKPRLVGTFSPIPGVFQGPYFYYGLSIFYVLYNGDPYGGQVYMVIAGLLAIIVSYVLAKKILGLPYGLVVAFLFGLSPAAVAASRMLWPPYLLFLLMPFYIYFLVKACYGSAKSFILCILFASLIFSFEIPSGLVLFLPAFAFFWWYQKKRLNTQLVIKSSVAALIPVMPVIIFNVRHDNLALKGIMGVFRGVYSSGAGYASYLESTTEHMGSFMLNFSSSFFWYPLPNYAAYGLLIVVLFSSAYLFHRKLLSGEEKITLHILLGIPLLVFIQFIPFKNVLWSWYLVMLHPVYLFLVGLLLYKLSSIKLGRTIFIAVLLLLVSQAVKQLHFISTKEIHDNGGAAKIQGKLEAIDAIYADANGHPFNVLVFMPPVYTYPYDYLFTWYGKKKYGYIPGKEKEGNFYLLIEPDPSKEWSYKGWEETVIKEGTVEWTKKLPSGLIVEKRYK